MSTERRTCNQCSIEKPISKFQPLKSGNGYYKTCSKCLESPEEKITKPATRGRGVAGRGRGRGKPKIEEVEEEPEDAPEDVLYLLADMTDAFNKLKLACENGSKIKAAQHYAKLSNTYRKYADKALS